MNIAITNASEYRNLPLELLTESTTNRVAPSMKTFSKAGQKAFASSAFCRPCLCVPRTSAASRSFFGAQRYRSAQKPVVRPD